MSDTHPLSGLTVLVTRARQQSARLADELERLGASVIAVPVISIGPPQSWDALDQALSRLSTYDWAVFVSTNAVESCLARMKHLGKDASEFATMQIAAIGPATAEALRAHALEPTFHPSRFVAETLVAEFPGYPHLSGVKVFWPRSNVGRTYILDQLRKAGAEVDVFDCYRASLPDDPGKTGDLLIDLLGGRQIDVITLASAQTARNFSGLLADAVKRQSGGKCDLAPLLEGIVVAAIGPETARAARELLGKVDIEASDYSIPGLVRALAEMRQERA